MAISFCLMFPDSSNIIYLSCWRLPQGAFWICITQCFQEPYSLLQQLSDQLQLPANSARQWTLRLCMIDHRSQGVKLLATFSDAILRPHVHDLGRGIEQVITQVDSDWKRRFRNESLEAIWLDVDADRYWITVGQEVNDQGQRVAEQGRVESTWAFVFAGRSKTSASRILIRPSPRSADLFSSHFWTAISLSETTRQDNDARYQGERKKRRLIELLCLDVQGLLDHETLKARPFAAAKDPGSKHASPGPGLVNKRLPAKG